jgi:hypothetical protein
MQNQEHALRRRLMSQRRAAPRFLDLHGGRLGRSPDLRALGTAMLLAAALLGGCAEMSKSDCVKADWHSLGRQDAMNGYAAERFAGRSEACRKNGVAADADEYMAGHAQGQAAYCTADRGRDDALAGIVPAAACAAPAGPPYREAYADALPEFCTVRKGYDLGRNGFRYRNTCTGDLALPFDIGFRAGKEVHDLNARLDEITDALAEERRLAADAQTPRERRQEAERKIRQLDAEETSVRRKIRDAERAALEMAAASTVAVAAALPEPPPAPLSAAEATRWLPGHWQLTSVRFSFPVDLNRDGTKSDDAMDEYSDCVRDEKLELGADRSAVHRIGAGSRGCKPNSLKFRWSATASKVRDVRYERGRRIVSERPVVLLRLTNSANELFDPAPMVIESIDDQSLVVRTERHDGTDSTSEAVLVYSRSPRR